MKFIIDRKKWYRGKGVEESRLLRNDGLQCCVGQMCTQLGIGDEFLLDKRAVTSLSFATIKTTVGILTDLNGYGTWVNVAYNINDNVVMSDEQREKKLTELAKENGHELEFVN